MKQVKALQEWDPSKLPEWLDEEYYRQRIMPKLETVTVSKVRLAVDISHSYAAMIRKGIRIPHPRHWLTLASLVGITYGSSKY